MDGEEREGEAEGGVHQGAVLSHTGGKRCGLCTLVQVQTLAQVFLSRVNQGCIGIRAREEFFFTVIEVSCGKWSIVDARMSRGVSVSE